MVKKNAWVVESDLIGRFLDVLTNNGFVWRSGEKANEVEDWDYGDTIIFIEETSKTIVYVGYFFCSYDPYKEYNLTEVTEEWLQDMEHKGRNSGEM